ncbi:MAG: DNA-deoxyinosine glycosylase [bacterium]|nr:DNA-deoxyinosine glycosylase [Clostridium sp.]MCM1536835.1 DNA-deoxyinosine glycosylase [bacterium]
MEKSKEYQHVTHEFGPIYDARSEVVILGSFPSVKSREQQFYYGHPQNRFWKVIAALTAQALPQTIGEKKELLLSHHIALWDVIASCDIVGSSDSSIRNVMVNDIRVITDHAPVHTIFLNGNKAYQLFAKYMREQTALPAVRLPSSSPANAACSLERLTAEWDRALGRSLS